MLRRDFVTAISTAAAAGLAAAQSSDSKPEGRKGRFKQSAMLVNFPPNTPLEEVCKTASRAGCAGVDLIPPADWPLLRKYGLTPSIYHDLRHTFEAGLIHPEVHDEQEKILHASIDRAAADGCPTVALIGGAKRGMSVEEGSDHAVALLNRLKAHAEDKSITMVMEPVNPVDRPDQILNHMSIAAGICQRVNSPRIKILFDIYHAQRIDGDVCENIRKYYAWIGHFHTAGVPGRHEIDETQELNYHFIAQTIAGLGYTGFIAHEYRPSPGRDPAKSLERAVEIMTV